MATITVTNSEGEVLGTIELTQWEIDRLSRREFGMSLVYQLIHILTGDVVINESGS